LTPPRYSRRPLPPYRHLPGETPHPLKDPAGHSFGRQEPEPELLPPDRWREMEPYLYGIDLFNAGYFWEAHEVWEGLWRVGDMASAQVRFLQALIQTAAACLKARGGNTAGVAKLRERALGHLTALEPSSGPTYMGLPIADIRELLARLTRSDDLSPPIPLLPR
jgi:hypothetical protein